jgi:predicted O-methyltransferase YrrM
MEIINREFQEYAEAFSSKEPEELSKLNRETYVNHLFPRMLSGHLQGRLLSMISHIVNPTRILEVGTYTGYSAICLAEGLAPGGVLHTIEINNENEDIIKKYLVKTNNTDRIILHFGDAFKIIPNMDETFDLVFLDADKERYIDYFKLVINKVRPGGILIVDNVLWDGKVLDDTAKDKESVGIKRFNEFIRDDNLVEKVLLTVRDGIMIVRKKELSA